MKRISRFMRRSAEEQRLFAMALPVVVAVRLALWLLPFRILRPVIERATPDAEPSGPSEALAHSVAWAVSNAARCVPRATCLTQALAAQLLLARRGFASEVCYGVARVEAQTVTAHAWLESAGNVVVGGDSLERFIPLTPLVRQWRARTTAAPEMETM